MAKTTTPDVLRLFSLVVDGRGYAGDVECTPPKLTAKTETTHVGLGDVEQKVGLEALRLEWTQQHYDADILAHFGLSEGNDLRVTLRGSFDRDGDAVPVTIEARGQIVEVDPGSWSGGGKPACKVALTCRFYRYEQAGREIHRINWDTQEFVVDGTDQLAAHRTAAGLDV